MNRKILFIIIITVICGLAITSCNMADIFQSENQSAPLSNSANIVPLSLETLDSRTDGIGKKDLDSSWDISTSTIITLDGATAIVSGTGAAVSGNTVTITEAGTYVVSGTLSKGQILINAAEDDNVRLVLNGVDITADKNAAIYAASANKLLIILADETTNTITDVSSYVYADTEKEEPDAAVFSKCDLTINGAGTFKVNANFKNGIKTKDDLIIVSGTYIINAVNNGLHGKDSVMIIDGNFDITSGNDGIKSSSGEKKGWVEIMGGVFNITSEYDGIQAETDLKISGGTFNIITGGGSANAPERSSGMGGGGGRGSGREPGGRPGGYSQSASNAESESKKSLKANNIVYITGGDFILDAYDDAIHSNADVIIEGGKFEIKTGDDGIHADTDVLIAGGDINIIKSYEGIEGCTVTIAGGNISVVASDDGINASNGEGKALNGGRPTSGASQGVYIRIAGGTVDVYGVTDGIDSNGHIYMEGGTLMVSGSSQIMEGAIDKDGDLIITGGEIITAGSWDNTPKESSQPVILLSYSKTYSAGTVIAIKDSTENTILEYTSKISFSMSGFTSPNFKTGETYTLYINGEKRIDIKLNSLATSLSDTGGAYSGGGGMGGSGGGRRR